MIGTILKIVAAVAIGLPLIVYLAQDGMIFYRQPLAEPRHAEIVRRFPAVKEISLTAPDGTRQHAWHIPAARGAPLVLYFGGNAEEVSWMIDEATRNAPGIGWLLVNYRGYGLSEGSPSQEALVQDALRWYDHMAEQPGPIFAFGRSLGSGVAVQLAAVRPLTGVILVTPFDSLRAVAQRYYPYLPVDWMLKHPFDSLALAPQLRMRLLCFAAADDEVIPAVHANRLFDAWAGLKQWVELTGARHNTTDSFPAFWPAVREFVAPPS